MPTNFVLGRLDQVMFKERHEQSRVLDLVNKLPTTYQRALSFISEKGESCWLTALPLSEDGYALHKGAFKDALCLRYGWPPPLLPSHCACGHNFTVEHAMSYPSGGFPSIRVILK